MSAIGNSRLTGGTGKNTHLQHAQQVSLLLPLHKSLLQLHISLGHQHTNDAVGKTPTTVRFVPTVAQHGEELQTQQTYFPSLR